MTDISRSSLDQAIDRGLDAIWRTQDDSGQVGGTCHGGPLYSGLALVARQLTGMLDSGDRVDVVRWLRTQQLADGSFPPSPAMQTGTLDATACVYAGLLSAGLPTDDATVAAARAYIDAQGGLAQVNPMYLPILCSAGLVSPESLSPSHLFIELVPFSLALMSRRFNMWVTMSSVIAPLMGAVEEGGRASLCHPLRRYEEKQALAFLTGVQNPEGSLAGVLLYTVQLVSALALMGVGRDNPHLQAGVQALESFRIVNDEGMEYMPFTAEVWNTAMAVRVTMRAGHDPEQPAVQRAIQWLLAKQTAQDTPRDWQNPAPGAPRQGGWSFEPSNVRNPDCDTTAAVLRALAWVLERKEIPAVRAALDKGLAWLLPMQNTDGGWPSMTRDNGTKPPGPLFTKPLVPPSHMAGMVKMLAEPPLELQDPSGEALSGRVIASLADCGFPPDHAAMHAAAAFLQAQQWHDRWWGRWEVNYLAGTAFCIEGLARAGVDMQADWVQRAVTWLASRQNADGGWGEGVETFVDWQAAGPWPSRADLTASVVMALLLARGPGDAAVTAGVRYLLATQQDDGAWDQEGLCVILPPSLFYTDRGTSLAAAVEALVRYRAALAS